MLDALIDRLAAFEPTGFPVLSLYLDARPDEHGRERFDAFVRKELAARAKTFAERSAERESFDADAIRIQEWLKAEAHASANGIAIFACSGADGFFEAVQQKALRLRQGLARIQDQFPNLVTEIRGQGLLAGLKLTVAPPEVVSAALSEKLLMVGAGDNVVRLLPPLIVSDDDIAEGVERLSRALSRVAKSKT